MRARGTLSQCRGREERGEEKSVCFTWNGTISQGMAHEREGNDSFGMKTESFRMGRVASCGTSGTQNGAARSAQNGARQAGRRKRLVPTRGNSARYDDSEGGEIGFSPSRFRCASTSVGNRLVSRGIRTEWRTGRVAPMGTNTTSSPCPLRNKLTSSPCLTPPALPIIGFPPRE
jgi:hypothetical protein